MRVSHSEHDEQGTPCPDAPTSAAPTASSAGITPPEPASSAPTFVPTTFRQPCPCCDTSVPFPFDEQLSAKLDALLIHEERIQDPARAEKAVPR